MHAPENFAGKAGVIQVTDASVDGTLYQVCNLIAYATPQRV